MPGTQNRSGGDRRSRLPDCFPLDGPPNKPNDLSPQESILWDEILGCIPPEILRKNDAYQLAVLVRLIEREKTLSQALRDDPADLPTGRAHLQTVAAIGRLSAAFGLSPIDRRRIVIEAEPEEESVFSELLSRMGGHLND